MFGAERGSRLATKWETRISSLTSTTHLASLWERLRTNFWFLPALLVAAAVALSLLLLELDSRIEADVTSNFYLVYTFGAEGARAVLSAIASSMITVAGLTFSVTMLTLQLASSQFGPRLLRNFMRDRGNQIVLGSFIATFVYCLLVLRTVRGGNGSTFVPHLSVAFGVLLAIASLAVLIYFIHHVANSIRIETQLAQLAAEVAKAIDALYPQELGREPAQKPDRPKTPAPPDFQTRRRCIGSQQAGYVQSVDAPTLMRAATKYALIVRVETRPGAFMVPDDPLLSVYPAERVDEDIAKELADAVIIGPERTPDQDLEFSIRRIVEIAQRALSPGTNDPTTALYCLDRLREAFLRLARRDIPSAERATTVRNCGC